LKRYGAKFKARIREKIPWILENLGDVLIVFGLLLIPLTTFFVDIIYGFYSLAVVSIIVGFLYIKGGGGD